PDMHLHGRTRRHAFAPDGLQRRNVKEGIARPIGHFGEAIALFGVEPFHRRPDRIAGRLRHGRAAAAEAVARCAAAVRRTRRRREILRRKIVVETTTAATARPEVLTSTHLPVPRHSGYRPPWFRPRAA